MLPARHFVPLEDGLVEVSKDDLPNGAMPDADFLAKEAISRALGELDGKAMEKQKEREWNQGVDNERQPLEPHCDFESSESTYVYPRFVMAAVMRSHEDHALNSPRIVEIEV